MKAFITVVISFLVSSSALANDFAAVVGFRSNSADSPTQGLTINSRTGFGVGVIGFFDLSSAVQLRSGFLYNQRNVAAEVPPLEIDFNLGYVDIPLTAMFRFADYGGVFVGPVVGLLANKSCSVSGGTCSIRENPQAMILAGQFGVSFKFAPQLGAEFYYEVIPSEYWKSGLENGRTVGANLLFTFE